MRLILKANFVDDLFNPIGRLDSGGHTYDLLKLYWFFTIPFHGFLARDLKTHLPRSSFHKKEHLLSNAIKPVQNNMLFGRVHIYHLTELSFNFFLLKFIFIFLSFNPVDIRKLV